MVDILATCWTTAGDALPVPGRLVSPLTLRERIEAASRYGFTGFGLVNNDLEVFLEESDLKTLHKILEDNGMRWVELEFIENWFADGQARAESDRVRDLLFRACDALGVHHIKVGPDMADLARPDIDRWAEDFHQLSQEAVEHGTTIAFEYLPFANCPNLSSAVELVRRAGHPAGGICLDIWHFMRSDSTWEELEALPLEFIKAVELDDATLEQVGDEYEDTTSRRVMLGQGEFDVTRFIHTISEIGWTDPWGVELISLELRQSTLDVKLPEVMRTTREAFALAGL